MSLDNMFLPAGVVEGFINSHGTEATINAVVGCVGCADSIPTGSVSGNIEFTKNGTQRRYSFNSVTASIVATLKTSTLLSLGAVFEDVTVQEIIGETSTITGCTLFLNATRLGSGSWIGSFAIAFPDGQYLFIYGTISGNVSVNRQVYCIKSFAPCDSTGAIPLESIVGIDSPAGTANLEVGKKYLSPAGAVINWRDSTITVCESGTCPNGNQNIWEVTGTPPQLSDGAGNKQLLEKNPNVTGALFTLQDGSHLIMSSSTFGGPVTKARFFLSTTPVNPTTLEGFDPVKTELYENGPNCTKIDSGLTLG